MFFRLVTNLMTLDDRRVMTSNALTIMTVLGVDVKLMYCVLAWHGFCSVSDYVRLFDSF